VKLDRIVIRNRQQKKHHRTFATSVKNRRADRSGRLRKVDKIQRSETINSNIRFINTPGVQIMTEKRTGRTLQGGFGHPLSE